jgi:nucleotide-binding universal stress UspA family protein
MDNLPAGISEMALKDIAVFVDPSPDGDDWLRFAARIARTHKARLSGIYIVGQSGRHSYVRGQYAIQSMIQSWFAAEQRCAVQSGKRFTKVVAQYKIPTNFRAVRSDSVTNDRIGLDLLLADMVVIGQKAPHGLPDGWRPERLLLACGIPLLVVPNGWREKMVAGHVIIAWNASKEVRRAVSDAMPLLASARSVTVFVVDPIDDQPCIDVALHLARHGIRARIEHGNSSGAPVAEVILSEASRHDADLVVIGAYSHARSTRAIFGGVTRSILKQATVPVLMSR